MATHDVAYTNLVGLLKANILLKVQNMLIDGESEKDAMQKMVKLLEDENASLHRMKKNKDENDNWKQNDPFTVLWI